MLRCIECLAEMETELEAQKHCAPDVEVFWKDGQKMHKAVVQIPLRRHTVVKVSNPNVRPSWKKPEKKSEE